MKARGISSGRASVAPGELGDADLDHGQRFVRERLLANAFTNSDRNAEYQLRVATMLSGGQAPTFVHGLRVSENMRLPEGMGWLSP